MPEFSRWILWWPVGMGIGIAGYFRLSVEPSAWVIGSLSLTLGLILFGVWIFARKTQFYQNTCFFFYGIISILFGFIVVKVRTDLLETTFLSEKVNAITVTGVVRDIEHPRQKRGEKRRVLLTDVHSSSLLHCPQTVRLNAPQKFIEAEPGDTISCVSDLTPIPFPISPQGYDLQLSCYYAGIGAVGRVKENCILVKKAPKSELARWRYRLTQTLRSSMPGTSGQIAAALITGDRSGIPKEVRQNFTDAGIAHILAISGLHISLVGGIIFFIVRRGLSLIPGLSERFFIKKGAAVVVVIATALYLAISGFGFPAQRAFMMTTLAMIGILVDRHPLSMRSLALAATVILIFFPESLLSISFQLSFAAVAALIATYEGNWSFLAELIFPKDYRRKWYFRYMAYGSGIILTTLVATLATTPLIVYTFNRFTLQAIAGNLLAIPLTSFWIMPAGVITLMSLIIGESKFFFYIWKSGIDLLVAVASAVANLPGSAILIATPPPLFLWLTTLGGLWICLWRNPWRWWGAIPVILGFLCMMHDHHPNLYMAADGSVMAYRHSNTLYVSSEKRGTFYTKIWQRELGLDQQKIWADPIVNYKNLS